MDFQLETRRVSQAVFCPHVRNRGHIFVGGIGAFLAEQSVFLQSAQLCDSVAQTAGIFLQVDGILLSILARGREIPGSIFI